MGTIMNSRKKKEPRFQPKRLAAEPLAAKPLVAERLAAKPLVAERLAAKRLAAARGLTARGLTALLAACLCVLPRASLAQEDSWWTLHSLDTRGTYLSAGGSYARWDDFTTSLSGQNYRVEYDDVGVFSATVGSAFVAQLLRFRYELGLFYGEGDLTVTRQTVSGRGSADFYGAEISFFYDSPPFLAGRLTPYIGVGVMLMGINLDLPSLADQSESVSANPFDDIDTAVVDTLKGDAEFAYGFNFLAGTRVELASILALDIGYRYGRVETSDNRGRARFVGEEFHEGRAALVLRY